MAVMIPLALVWVLVLFVIGRGLSKGVEAANKVFLPLLVILFLALVVRALFLPGAVEGLNAFFTPTGARCSTPTCGWKPSRRSSTRCPWASASC